MAKQEGLEHLQHNRMEDQTLVEEHAKAATPGDVVVTCSPFRSSDMISGALSFGIIVCAMLRADGPA